MGIVLLFALQLAVALAGFALIWRRLEQTRAELDEARRRLDALESEASVRLRLAAPASEPATDRATPESPAMRAARAWSGAQRATATPRAAEPALSPELRMGAALAMGALAPAFGFVFSTGGIASVCTGIIAAAAMMALALRPAWRAAAWAGVGAGGVWAAIGFAVGAADAAPGAFAATLATAGIAGCLYAYLRQLGPGALLAAIAAAAALVIAARTDMIGAPGAAFAAVTATAAIVGASSLRLELLHVGAFIVSLVGLYVLSGQPSAAIWFTPAAGLTGAAFFAIAAVRVPALGSRGVTLAGSGALAPLAMVATLGAAQHGLADRLALGGAYLFAAAALGGLLALAAGRRADRLSSLGATLWILAIAAAVALAGGILSMAPLALAPAAFAALPLLLFQLDERRPHFLWRALSGAFAATAAIAAIVNAHRILDETAAWPGGAALAAAVAAPAVMLGLIAWRMRFREAPMVSGLFQFLASGLLILGANVAIRLAFSGGAVRLNPLTLAEAGVHICVWLLASLIIAINNSPRERPAHTGASAALAIAAMGATALAALLSLTPYWSARQVHGGLPLALGMLLPALFFGAHWALLRARGSHLRTRIAFAACVLSLGAAAAMAVLGSDSLPPWARGSLGALALCIGITLNFAPGIVLHAVRKRRHTRLA